MKKKKKFFFYFSDMSQTAPFSRLKFEYSSFVLIKIINHCSLKGKAFFNRGNCLVDLDTKHKFLYDASSRFFLRINKIISSRKLSFPFYFHIEGLASM